jgi:RNA polymerase sigma-70 factor (sigma-E family)
VDAIEVSGRGVRTSVASDFDDFVLSCSTRLLRTAYLLTRDHGRAEDLVQTALAKAWLSWSRIDSDPTAYVRKTLINTYATWWRRRWNDERPTGELPDPGYDEDRTATHDLWVALGRLPRGQRAVIVLRYFEDLSEAETARCSTARSGP